MDRNGALRKERPVLLCGLGEVHLLGKSVHHGGHGGTQRTAVLSSVTSVSSVVNALARHSAFAATNPARLL